jgi:uncharacterized membrane protein
MTILVIGIALWWGAHLFKRVAPDARARMGDRGKGAMAILLIVSLGFMIIGYRSAPVVNLWYPPDWLTGVNNLLMVLAVLLFAMSGAKGTLRGRMRHPMLTGVKTWALAHLLVNGDLASVVLFGGMLGWAIVSVIVINRAESWTRPEPGSAAQDIRTVVIAAIVFVVIAVIHHLLGVWPFSG